MGLCGKKIVYKLRGKIEWRRKVWLRLRKKKIDDDNDDDTHEEEKEEEENNNMDSHEDANEKHNI